MKNTAFFDLDGTISAPLFKSGDGKLVTGFVPKKWLEFLEQNTEHAYDDCKIIIPTVEYAMSLTKRRWDCKILTVGMSEFEKAAKTEFIKRLPDNLFSEILFTNINEKPKYILQYATTHGLTPNQCMLIEDDIMAVLLAGNAGIRTMHISHIFTGAYDAANA